jgi:hypothetical protein
VKREKRSGLQGREGEKEGVEERSSGGRDRAATCERGGAKYRLSRVL